MAATILSLLLISSIPSIFTQSSVCFEPGICANSFLIEEMPADTKNECLLLCQDTPMCEWFSYNLELSACNLFTNCKNLSAEKCPQCVSGQKDCTQHFSCGVQGHCQGIFLYEENQPSYISCLSSCDANPDCQWITYDNRDDTCMFFQDCIFSVDDSCETCISGQKGCNNVPKECSNGGERVSASPGDDMVICKDMQENTCEQDFETLCPVGWNLCTPLQFNHRNFGWDFEWKDSGRPLGVIYCRSISGAGQFGLHKDILNQDEPANCHYGSSRPGCETDWGCDEKDTSALCCLPRSGCGNGVVDHVEEECDDGNQVETDDCLASCTWRTPTDHGIIGLGC